MRKEEHIANRIVNSVIYHGETAERERERKAADFSERFIDEDVTRKMIYLAIEEEIDRIEDEEYTSDIDKWYDDESVRSIVIDKVTDIVSDNL